MTGLESPDVPVVLPAPVSERWQPLRSGLLNLYRYDYEEFHFEQGRLLLRGNNGTGKSRILALQLPFLLDGEITPSRVEPDGDPAKRIEWNLLMGRWPDRLGYTWIEFGRRLADGSADFITLGCGLRAVAGHSGLHSRWFFITQRRIGRDLFLQNAQRQPLGRDRLTEAIGAAGEVFQRAEDYRRAVDRALFGLGPRYGPLLELLIRLRRPQLSRKLDEAELSQTLSEALPVLAANLIDEVAEAFRSLQADREALRGFSETRNAVEAFLGEYGLYAQAAASRRAALVRAAHSAFEEAQRQVRAAERRAGEAEAEFARLALAQATAEQSLAGVEEEERTLRASPEMRTAEELEQAARSADVSSQALQVANADETRAVAASEQAQARLLQAEGQSAEVTKALEEALLTTDAIAQKADLAAIHREEIPPPPARAWLEMDWVRRTPVRLDRAVHRRREAVTLLRTLEAAYEAARQALHAAEEDRRRAADACTAARETEVDAQLGLDRAVETLLVSYRSWHSRLRVIKAPPAEDLAAEFLLWLERRSGPSPLIRAADSAYREATAGLMEKKSRLVAQIDATEAAAASLRAEIGGLESGRPPLPPVPPFRRADRSGRLGAPLWRLCDFRPEVLDTARAGLEAALEASGLLDAWLSPDGRIVDPATEDTFLRDVELEARAPTFSLAAWMVPVLDPADTAAREIGADTIAQLLARIGLGRDTGAHWVAEDGSWRLGPLTGRATKPAADYIGESTRAAARRRRLAELRALLAGQEEATARLRAESAEFASAQSLADEERGVLPDDEEVRSTGFRLEAASRTIAAAFRAQEEAERQAGERRGACEGAAIRRDSDAGDLGLLAWVGRLDVLERWMGDYSAALAGLWPTVRHWESAASQVGVAREQAAAAAAERDERSTRCRRAAEAAAAARSRLETLQQMHGATVTTVLARLRDAETRLTELKHTLRANQEAQRTQSSARAAAESDRLHADSELHRHDHSRQEAIASLQRFADQRLLGEAHPELKHLEDGGWTVTRAVEIARQVASIIARTPLEEEWRRRQDAIHGHIQELRDRLIAHGHQPEAHQIDDFVLVRCVFQGRPHTMSELRAAFASEIAERDRLLAAREKEIIENHLLGEIAVELQQLIRGAEEWIASANAELAARPTSTGLRFRFAWEAESESDFAGVRRIFLRTSALWSPEERSAITRFLQERIRTEQAANEEGSWREHLAAALDYRRWHRFAVERQQEGQWRRLDKRTYGTGSGGEKALALTLPRFAAAAAHYRSARPEAPRLVMLDEAFAGIDPAMRAQCLGVLAQFDLDVVMTSENEWGCYATVPGLAIYHLTALQGIDAVAATRWVWNGHERRQVDAMVPPAAPTETAG